MKSLKKDCLRDPVHFEFFRRFAKAFNFERALRFWKHVETIKHTDDSQQRQLKIRNIKNQFFSRGKNLGIEGEILKDLSRTPPDRISISMLISAQACVMKSIEDEWGERYLSTFPETKKISALQLRQDRKIDYRKGMKSDPGKLSKNWLSFYSFIRRAGKFMAQMKNNKLRFEFEQFLTTVGRDPRTYQDEGWGEVEAQTIEPKMNAELMYHTKLRHGRYIVAEFLINDFRFFNEVMSYRDIAKAFKSLQSSGKFNAHESAQVHLRVRLSDLPCINN